MKRDIHPDMVNWLDAKLAQNGLAQFAIAQKDARLVFGLAAESCVGIVESGGNNNGPLVRLLQETIGRAEGEPWCASFVQTCLAYAELKTDVRSAIFPTEHCLTMWNESPHVLRVKTSPLKYAIVVWRNEGSNSGHTGVLLETDKRQWFKTCEGNTNGAGSREGHGVFYKHRNWIRDGNLLRVGFLKPF